MCEEYNSVLSRPTEADKSAVLADTNILVKPKYRPGRYISLSLISTIGLLHKLCLFTVEWENFRLQLYHSKFFGSGHPKLLELQL